MDQITYPLADNEAYRLRTLYDLQAIDAPPEPEFQHIAKTATEAFGVQSAVLTLVDAEEVLFVASYGMPLGKVHRKDAFCAYTVLGDALFIVLDAAAHPVFKDNGLVTGPASIRFYAGAPLVIEGAAIGALCLIDNAPRAAFPDADKKRFRQLAEEAVDVFITQRQAQCMAASQNARAMRKTGFL